MTICIHDIAKKFISCPKTGFLAPQTRGCVTSYLLTTQNSCLHVTPQFQNIDILDLDTNKKENLILQDFCKKYLDCLDAIIVCVGEDQENSIQQLVNDIQIFQADQSADGADVVYQNDRLDHGRTCNSVHWHYQRTSVSVNKNSPLLCNLPSRNFAACYLPKARFTQMPGLNLDGLRLCQSQIVTDISPFCKTKALGLVPWRKNVPLINTHQLKNMCKTDWYVGITAFILGFLALSIIYTKNKGRVCYH